MTRFFPPLICLLLASAAASQSWHDDSRYVPLGPRSGYYIVRPGSHLVRQLGLEGAPISDTADPFRHGYGADALAFQFDRAGRLLRAPAYVVQGQPNNFYTSRWVSSSAAKVPPQKYNPSSVISAERNNDGMASLVTTRSKFTILLRITGAAEETSRLAFTAHV
jgi:hypothetical protein